MGPIAPENQFLCQTLVGCLRDGQTSGMHRRDRRTGRMDGQDGQTSGMDGQAKMVQNSNAVAQCYSKVFLPSSYYISFYPLKGGVGRLCSHNPRSFVVWPRDGKGFVATMHLFALETPIQHGVRSHLTPPRFELPREQELGHHCSAVHLGGPKIAEL